MAKSFERKIKVAEAIKRELAQIVQSGGIRDDRMAALVSILDVEVSSNLRYAKITFSVLDDEPASEVGTKAALEANAGRLRGEVARKINLRYAPQFVFECNSLKKGSELIDLISKVNDNDDKADSTSQD